MPKSESAREGLFMPLLLPVTDRGDADSVPPGSDRSGQIIPITSPPPPPLLCIIIIAPVCCVRK